MAKMSKYQIDYMFNKLADICKKKNEEIEKSIPEIPMVIAKGEDLEIIVEKIFENKNRSYYLDRNDFCSSKCLKEIDERNEKLKLRKEILRKEVQNIKDKFILENMDIVKAMEELSIKQF